MPKTLELVPPQYQENYKAHTNLEAEARKLALAIKDDASYREACEFRVMIDKQKKNWAIVIKPAVSAAHQAHQKIKDVENAVAQPLGDALDILDPQISRWRVEQENQRRITQEKINAKLRKDEEDRRLAEAQALHDSGKKEEAAAILDEPIQAVEVVLPPTTKVSGISDRIYWSAEVFDIVKLCKAIGEGKVSPVAVAPNMVFLGGLARSMKSAMNAEWEPKGVRAVSRNDISGGR
jgi:hypothetical protein